MSATAFQRMRREAEAKRLKAIEAEANDSQSDMTVKEIKALLDEKGIEYNSKSNKEELIKLLEEAE